MIILDYCICRRPLLPPWTCQPSPLSFCQTLPVSESPRVCLMPTLSSRSTASTIQPQHMKTLGLSTACPTSISELAQSRVSALLECLIQRNTHSVTATCWQVPAPVPARSRRHPAARTNRHPFPVILSHGDPHLFAQLIATSYTRPTTKLQIQCDTMHLPLPTDADKRRRGPLNTTHFLRFRARRISQTYPAKMSIGLAPTVVP